MVVFGHMVVARSVWHKSQNQLGGVDEKMLGLIIWFIKINCAKMTQNNYFVGAMQNTPHL